MRNRRGLHNGSQNQREAWIVCLIEGGRSIITIADRLDLSFRGTFVPEASEAASTRGVGRHLGDDLYAFIDCRQETAVR